MISVVIIEVHFSVSLLFSLCKAATAVQRSIPAPTHFLEEQ
jgi:hypothetical protein